MKKLLLLALAITSVTTMYAQPGTWLVYGNGSFSQNTNSNSNVSSQGNNTNWSVAPGIGYQFNKHLTAGIQGSYNHTENAQYMLSPVGSSIPYYYTGGITIDWSAGAFFRYTQKVGKIFSLYGQANMSYISSELYNAPYYYYLPNGTAVSETRPKTNGFQVQLFPAVSARVYKGLALNFSFGGINYTTQSQNIDGAGTNKSSNIQVTFGQQVNFGISDNFNCHMMHHRKHHHHAEAGAELRHTDMSAADDDDAPAPVTEKHKKHKKEKEEKTDNE